MLTMPTYWVCVIASYAALFLTPWMARICRRNEQSLTILATLYASGDLNGTPEYHRNIFLGHAFVATAIGLAWSIWLHRTSIRHTPPEKWSLGGFMSYATLVAALFATLSAFKAPSTLLAAISFPVFAYPCYRLAMPMICHGSVESDQEAT